MKQRKAPSEYEVLRGNKEPDLSPEQIAGWHAMAKLAEIRAKEDVQRITPVERKRKIDEQQEQLTWARILARQ